MADILPFRGIRYNQQLIDNLAKVICPPYDIISAQLQQELYHRSEYNFVRLEHGRELPQDTATDNKYSRSSATLEQWLKQGILKIDSMPAIYLYDHYFTYREKEYKRRGIIVCVRLEDSNERVVRPHEGILAKPRSDRLNLLRILKADTSPILALFEDQKQQVCSLLATQESGKPVIDFTSTEGEKHIIRPIIEPQIIKQIHSHMAEQPLYIADGHHRYESALAYQREQYTYSTVLSGDEAHNFVMMTLVDLSDPGLIILPAHRLLRGIPRPLFNGLPAKLKAIFEVDEISLKTSDNWQPNASSTEDNQTRLFIFGLTGNRILSLKLRNPAATNQMMPYFHSEIYKKLDVSIVDHIILEKLLGEEAEITYSYDISEAVNRVLDQEYQLAFLLTPIKPEVVKAIANANDRLPRKSTYFYPKLPAGLVFYRLV